MSKHLYNITIIPFLLVIFLLRAGITIAEEQPLWWEQAEAEARREGYHLITLDELESLYQSGKDFIILDVRPDYEYKRAHLPQAANLEFHLGERLSLDPAKRKEFEKLLGPNKDRTIVIYCRSFR
ncbi:MAG: rhodanese-like domain-containing protein [Deltaproteobacteria bacterium]|nr:rhodanese-like domain-containing protein [Deltaproteobacteria bacterium]